MDCQHAHLIAIRDDYVICSDCDKRFIAEPITDEAFEQIKSLFADFASGS